jgi:hypothetical protein
LGLAGFARLGLPRRAGVIALGNIENAMARPRDAKET